MEDIDLQQLVSAAKEVYETRLKAQLEQTNMHDFVAVEPESGEYFLGKTLSEAARAARIRFPGRLTHVIRVGHQAALHIGGVYEGNCR
jgi:hypothetical protein